ncbi:Xaa-Pro dipeptidase [Thalassotalea agarivorans]|uniref:Xaa-Pro dipeptidase n=1 Tax=Thalassotalea agarivorans TaxID=349064 RepID=A0A1I0GDB0_THASX|nr:Xaa-Pro dipeptidase [Thalassotalea agarivorans]SET68812.1 Xaa-Pro dipeptidase Metallo peptidase. MEROPS family M24B [Thalassotalea agarivorans]
MTTLASLYPAHLETLMKRAKDALSLHKLDSYVIHSGQDLGVFLDDMHYPFKANPHFKHWVPVTDVTNSYIIVDGSSKPTLVYYQPVDFWHKVYELQDDYWTSFFDIKLIAKKEDIAQYLPTSLNNVAYVGAHQDYAASLGFSQINPTSFLHYLHYYRAYKTPYEQECMRLSNAKAVIGHQAAKNTFLASGSEFDIQQAYLAATGHTANETPYGNIVALNENASILHYTALEKETPFEHRSFLIDAGANFHGYASDITRTYAFENNEFAALIARMDNLMLAAVEKLQADTSYVDLHIQTHFEVAKVLSEFNFITVAPESAVESGVVSAFFPHGLGHHLGLQTHDVGGFMADDTGTHVASPTEHPFLRTSRPVEAGMVFTIEPGLYFIDSLLQQAKNDGFGDQINWTNVDLFKPFGGIRIEDNIIVHPQGNENMTRDHGLD